MNKYNKSFIEMKKKLCYVALAFIAMTGCTSNDYVGDQEKLEAGISRPISFGFDVPTPTRAAGEKTAGDAAADLSNQFIVWGEKNETSENVGTAAGADGRSGHLVFKNYLVNWYDYSAYTTTSNTKGWEYVGLKLDDGTATPSTESYSTNISPNSGTDAQTIKYWDYGASTYTFTAISALPADISAGNVKITKTQSGTTVYDKGYSVVLTEAANLDKLFFAERINIATSANTDRNQANKYGGNVTFRFHNAATKVRVAMYETVPGYSVKIKEFKVADAADPAFTDMTDNVTANFAANLQNCAKGIAGNLTVTYRSSEIGLENHPKVSFSGTKANVLTLGTNLAANTQLGTSTTEATFDKSDKAYTSVFPNETNAQNLKLKLSYTLEAPVTGETIEITDKTAEIPAQYLQWKPGYAYTYIFKITDDNLYPITFDAVEILAEDGSAEYITTVTEPSITTFGVKGGKYVAGKDEYEAGSDIYATFMKGSAVQTPTVGGSGAQHVNVFKVTSADASLITEASVAEAIANPAMTADIYTRTGEGSNESPYVYTKVTDATTITAGTTYYKTDGSKAPGEDGYTETTAVAGTDYKVGAKINVTNITTDASTNFSSAPVMVTTVPGEDGVEKTINALKLTGVKAGTYAIEYESSEPTTKVYKVIRVVDPS